MNRAAWALSPTMWGRHQREAGYCKSPGPEEHPGHAFLANLPSQKAHRQDWRVTSLVAWIPAQNNKIWSYSGSCVFLDKPLHCLVLPSCFLAFVLPSQRVCGSGQKLAHYCDLSHDKDSVLGVNLLEKLEGTYQLTTYVPPVMNKLTAKKRSTKKFDNSIMLSAFLCHPDDPFHTS